MLTVKNFRARKKKKNVQINLRTKFLGCRVGKGVRLWLTLYSNPLAISSVLSSRQKQASVYAYKFTSSDYENSIKELKRQYIYM